MWWREALHGVVEVLTCLFSDCNLVLYSSAILTVVQAAAVGHDR